MIFLADFLHLRLSRFLIPKPFHTRLPQIYKSKPRSVQRKVRRINVNTYRTAAAGMHAAAYFCVFLTAYPIYSTTNSKLSLILGMRCESPSPRLTMSRSSYMPDVYFGNNPCPGAKSPRPKNLNCPPCA